MHSRTGGLQYQQRVSAAGQNVFLFEFSVPWAFVKYETLIIGAGLSGLAAGIRLAYFDKKVRQGTFQYGGMQVAKAPQQPAPEHVAEPEVQSANPQI